MFQRKNEGTGKGGSRAQVELEGEQLQEMEKVGPVSVVRPAEPLAASDLSWGSTLRNWEAEALSFLMGPFQRNACQGLRKGLLGCRRHMHIYLKGVEEGCNFKLFFFLFSVNGLRKGRSGAYWSGVH